MKTLNQLFDNPQSDLQQMLQKAQQIERLQRFLQPFLPEPIRAECTIANYQLTQLKILVSNASVATTVRFLVPQLLSHLHSKPHWQFFQDISISIQKRPPLEPLAIEPLNNQPKREIPPEAMEGFLWLATQEEDKELQRVLEKIARKK